MPTQRITERLRVKQRLTYHLQHSKHAQPGHLVSGVAPEKLLNPVVGSCPPRRCWRLSGYRASHVRPLRLGRLARRRPDAKRGPGGYRPSPVATRSPSDMRTRAGATAPCAACWRSVSFACPLWPLRLARVAAGACRDALRASRARLRMRQDGGGWGAPCSCVWRRGRRSRRASGP